MAFYFKLVDGYIMDAIEYPCEGYTEVALSEGQLPLPAGINGGWYTWNGTTYAEDLDKKPVSALEEQVATLQNTVDQLVAKVGL